MFSKNIFAERIKQLRVERNLNQNALAKEVGVSNKSISMIENEQRAASIETIYAIADYFNVSLDYLVGRSDNPEINK